MIGIPKVVMQMRGRVVSGRSYPVCTLACLIYVLSCSTYRKLLIPFLKDNYLCIFATGEVISALPADLTRSVTGLVQESTMK